MELNKVLSYVGHFMKIFNFMVIAFISIIIANTTYLISNSQGSREFLEQISVLPVKPNTVIIRAVIFYTLLLIIMAIKKMIEQRSLFVTITFFCIEVFLCLILMWTINMSYSGIILLVIADLVTHIKYKKNKVFFLSVIIIIYILSDYDFVSLKFKMVSFSELLTYYNTNLQNYILGLKSMIISINIMSFILYLFILMKIQVDENNKIIILNNKLNEANNELKLMNIKLQDYAKATEKMTETRERNRLAREIHDTIGHALTGIIAGIDACFTIFDYSPEDVKKQLVVISDVARKGMKEVRRSVKALRPDALETLTLEEAIKRMIEEISTASKSKVIFNNFIDNLKFNSDEEDAIYRVIQEGITNAIRHGKATEVCVSLSKEANYIKLVISDNGIGCANIKKGFGLRHMKERVELLNGNIRYYGNEGFTIIANIPIRWSDSV